MRFVPQEMTGNPNLRLLLNPKDNKVDVKRYILFLFVFHKHILI